ncbi:hypothetical protein DCS_00854 [Drechmeria coniospora]|uniref:CID domain-containing protein n=1 Tax=Drechmeria coniospora TaxID=98403 RepID=A0A151GRK6_DRECN|nr:hypothetical protein DCS_00854 [Drechmeria coniospora]KYK59720.1 hypothetical protein DCS_00854 [Drechmeria coniospora]
MAYNDDSVLARLSSLNESHDSIATAAQWIMFHKRHADRTVQLWMQRLKDSSSTRRLSLVYLANEVVQQSRIRHKEDFVIAFSPVVAEATSVAYRGAPAEIQAKLRRVIDVWKDRSIFEPPIQAAIEARLEELDKSRGATNPGFRESPFRGSTVPSELAPLVSTYQTATKLSNPVDTTLASANQEYEKQAGPHAEVPSAPVYAARLNGLLKTLVNAESALAECVKARESLVSGLEKLLDAQRAALSSHKTSATVLRDRKVEIENKKQQVEVAIMRALGPAEDRDSMQEGEFLTPDSEPDRPKMESLTPPAVEALTPPAAEALTPPVMGVEAVDPLDQEPATASVDNQPTETASSHHSIPVSTNVGTNKRRRIDDPDGYSRLEGDDDGIDADVAEMLKDG